MKVIQFLAHKILYENFLMLLVKSDLPNILISAHRKNLSKSKFFYAENFRVSGDRMVGGELYLFVRIDSQNTCRFDSK